MISKIQFDRLKAMYLKALSDTGIAITPKEAENFEIADFGLSNPETTGLGLVVYVNTARCCAKELVLLPQQTCPEHRHPMIDDMPGKEETFRCRQGVVYLYVAGEPTEAIEAVIPKGDEKWYTVFHQIILHPGDQYTMDMNTLHWFQAGSEGAVVSEFSTASRDDCDIFTNPAIKRAPEVKD